MTPLHGIACFYDVGFGARAVSRKTPIYFIGGKDKNKDKDKYDGGEFDKDNDDEQGRKGQIRDLLDRGALHISFSADSTSS